MNKFNNETLTILLEDLKQEVRSSLKELKKEVGKIDEKITSLSNGQSLLGGTYEELRDVCKERWERFETFQSKLEQEKREADKKLKESKFFSPLSQNKKLLFYVMPWMLLIAITIFAILTNNPMLINTIISKIHI